MSSGLLWTRHDGGGSLSEWLSRDEKEETRHKDTLIVMEAWTEGRE